MAHPTNCDPGIHLYFRFSDVLAWEVLGGQDGPVGLDCPGKGHRPFAINS